MKFCNKMIMAVATATLAISGCEKDEQVVKPPVPGNELLTTVKIFFQNKSNSADTLWAVWRDLTPDDAHPPDTSKAVINLKKGATYKASVRLYDETKSPPEEITQEVIERANYHLYLFLKHGEVANRLTITATDRDTNNPPLPLGLENDFVTDTIACIGRLEGVLRHQPSGKDGSFAPGSTDSDVFFTLNIIP